MRAAHRAAIVTRDRDFPFLALRRGRTGPTVISLRPH